MVRQLIALRHRKGLTQRALAEILNMPRSCVSKIESNERRIDAVELIHYPTAMRASPTVFIKSLVTELTSNGMIGSASKSRDVGSD
jgi:transcriptional regulator with XRE-family HTH domain